MQLDTIVVIARFDPVHAGHLRLLEQASELAPHVAILIGSAHRPRSARHPWTIAERQAQIEVMWKSPPPRLTFSATSDHLYSEGNWAVDVRARISELTADSSSVRIGLLAGPQQNASALRNLFPDWTIIEPRHSGLVDASELRKHAFDANTNGISQQNPGDHFDSVRQEFSFLRDYWQRWSHAPYPVNFVTVDALVTHRDSVLLIRRRNHPGQGLLALPGGFLDVNEPIQDAAIRELREETGLELSQAQAISALQRTALFDVPDRSLRGRTITHVFHFDLPGSVQPRVEAADDASQVLWMPISAVPATENQFFEDHFDILEHMLLLR